MALSVEELRSKAAELRAKGLNTQQIADELSVSQTTVQWLSSEGVELPPDDVRIGWRTIGARATRIEAIGLILADIIDEELTGQVDTIVGISLNGIAFAQSLAGHIDADFAIYRSVDEDGSGHLSNKYGNVAGRDVAVIDDVLSTGSTMRRTIEALRSEGANVCLCMVLVNKTERNEIEGVPLRGLIRAVNV
ncbi:MAG TPA: orotate phosphoribosyltransferase-like protein [Candidatus Thalassarchaeaceae archaeon]|nr:MAG TPA: orotate phosphoribosyltransferase-like protein [Candidatus Poseidoniales archaeon]HII48350.1 orotate phosphoribosyltransferase-like protein [Candidatus Thalassarchaeaceae archaeon]|tara:strand:- start:7 stop:582 length:576 start_codon:yes stop_codon:yes gene_type:complete